ncbi:transposase, partial [Puniceicoccaceae bacterium K14]|nr:transposase [Puniceicoccaceae bacterium K14]
MSKREAELESELKAANLKIKLLEEKVDALLRNLYSSKSERLDPNQLTLLEDPDSKKDEAPVAAETKPGAASRESTNARKAPRGPRIPDHLPVKEEILDPEEVVADPPQWRHV